MWMKYETELWGGLIGRKSEKKYYRRKQRKICYEKTWEVKGESRGESEDDENENIVKN